MSFLRVDIGYYVRYKRRSLPTFNPPSHLVEPEAPTIGNLYIIKPLLLSLYKC